MPDKRNALAELASRLNPDRMTYDDLDMAQRVVAELAKVDDRREGESNADALWRCNDCIATCRAIAEEEGGYGK